MDGALSIGLISLSSLSSSTYSWTPCLLEIVNTSSLFCCEVRSWRSSVRWSLKSSTITRCLWRPLGTKLRSFAFFAHLITILQAISAICWSIMSAKTLLIAYCIDSLAALRSSRLALLPDPKRDYPSFKLDWEEIIDLRLSCGISKLSWYLLSFGPGGAL